MLKKIAAYFSCTADYLLELDNDRVFIDTAGLTIEQIAHIQLLVNDFKQLNPKCIAKE